MNIVLDKMSMQKQNDRDNIQDKYFFIVEHLRWRKKQFFQEISTCVKAKCQERRKKKKIQTTEAETNEIKFVTRGNRNTMKGERGSKNKEVGTERNEQRPPAWLPPIYKQYIKQPEKREFIKKQILRDISFNEICKSRYLRVPDGFLTNI